jgi:hypothetical protein
VAGPTGPTGPTGATGSLSYTPENSANKGLANGYASLDSNALVPSTQLPSYIDDVLEYANSAAFPGTGETGKIYVAADTSRSWRWTGSVYAEIIASPGTTDAVTEGTTNLYYTATRADGRITAAVGTTVVGYGGALGTPSSGTLTNCTGLPVGGISATGTASSTTYLRGDGSWQTVAATGETVNPFLLMGA